MAQLFCHAEGRPFPSTEFAVGPSGVDVHVVSKTHGHTTEGWTATYVASRSDDHWTIENVVIKSPAIEVADADPAGEPG
jgi:hypothetical protein